MITEFRTVNGSLDIRIRSIHANRSVVVLSCCDMLPATAGSGFSVQVLSFVCVWPSGVWRQMHVYMTFCPNW